jgi:autotransporter-associated beta strand protein
VDLLVSNSFVAALNWPATGGTGIIKNGAGTMRLTGTNTYQGPTIVNSGRFLVDGVQPTTGTLTAKDTGTLGGTGSAGAAAFEAGSFAELTLGSPLTLAKELVVATNGTLPVVKVNMPDDVAPGTYTLATYDATGSSGAFDSTPMIMSGSVVAGNVATISTGGGLVELVVGPDVSNPTLDYSIGSGQITFTWEGAYKLVAQTNSLNEGLGNVWYDYPGGGTSGVAVPIDPTSPAVFFQLQSQ